MSRTRQNNTGSRNPCKYFLEWKSADKCFQYWDKDAEKRKTIDGEGFKFTVLDQLNTVKGWSDMCYSGIWANEVRNVTTDPLTVMTKNGKLAEGLYKEIKNKEFKFTKSVYAMAKIDGDYKLVNLQLNGSALGPWIEFCDKAGNLEGDIVVGVTGTTEGKKGAVRYNSPVFEIVATTLSGEAGLEADKIDETLQDYLDAYFAAKDDGYEANGGASSEQDTAREATEDELASIDEDVPF